MSLAVVHVPAVIANGASESGVIDITERVLVAVATPAAWTAADITLLVSDTADGSFVAAYDASGAEVTIDADVSRGIAIAPDATRGFRYMKLRSGTSGVPVNQGAARTLSCALANDVAS